MGPLDPPPVDTTRVHLAASSDLAPWALYAAFALAAAGLLLLGIELRQRRARAALATFATGSVALGLLLVAVLRPVRVAARESSVGAKVVLLVDTSRSMALRDGARRRKDAADEARRALTKSNPGARFVHLGFGDGPPLPLAEGDASGAPEGQAGARAPRSDLATALRAVAAAADERPSAVVVLSDGQLDDPREDTTAPGFRALGEILRVPVHTVGTTREAPADASVRRVVAAGAAVAHVPLPLRVEIGCAGGVSCGDVTVTARELREDGPPAVLASGIAHVKDGKAVVDLTVTLDRAGARILEIAITPPDGDTIPENDRRLLTFHVARERVRVLHVAGRPTHDTRALRQWLKSDASVDVVAFFILRTPSDNPGASKDDLALIPFPVDELFSEHLPSFDAVVLQDFDAQPYGLEQHLPALARYVKSGGGLIMVGGPNSFVAGGYAGTPLAGVLPIALEKGDGATSADPATFVPQWTDQGRGAPLLSPLRATLGDELPAMPGTNVLGDAHTGAVVLWTHPTRKTKSGAPMPVLAVSDEGNGRSIAMAVDGGWELLFSALGARTGGRGHGALWDGLLGWLMRDPRFEPAQLDVIGGCVAGLPSTLRLRLLPAPAGAKAEPVTVDVTRIDAPADGRRAPPIHLEQARPASGTVLDIPLPAMDAGGYSARLRVGAGPTTRRDFACEAGGDEWADTRPDPDRLRSLSSASGGTFSWADDARKIPLPPPTIVSAERHVVPVAPPWVWSLAAALAVGLHWIVRRRSGLS